MRIANIVPFVVLVLCFSSCRDNSIEDDFENKCDSCDEQLCIIDTVSVVQFQRDVFPIFQRNCIGCHAREYADQRASGHIIDDYKSVKIYIENGLLLPAINWEAGAKAMPLGGEKLTTCELHSIEIWVSEGMINN